jgi:hypothetical protein
MQVRHSHSHDWATGSNSPTPASPLHTVNMTSTPPNLPRSAVNLHIISNYHGLIYLAYPYPLQHHPIPD